MMSRTMRQIAEELGVSTTTISKVLNNHADIGEATRARVLAKVAEHGYRPNAVARSLTLRRTHTLGVIVPDLMHSFFVEIVAGIEGFLSPRGYGLFVCNLAEDPTRERPQLEMLIGRQVDGVVLASSTVRDNADLLEALGAKGKGLVLVDRDDHPGIACHRVLTDDELVGRLATAHLLDLGHRAIAHISAHLAHAQRREAGYRAELARRGIAVRPEWLVPGGFLEQEGYDAMRRLLANRGDITAVFAVNDPAAVGALKAAWEAGVRVPEDMSIIGAGDIALGDLLRVPLSTISWSRKEIGTRAAQLILDQLEARPAGPFERVIVPPQVVARASTAPPPTASAQRRRLSAARAESGARPSSRHPADD